MNRVGLVCICGSEWHVLRSSTVRRDAGFPLVMYWHANHEILKLTCVRDR